MNEARYIMSEELERMWEETERIWEERDRFCREATERIFPKDKFEVREAISTTRDDKCLVDFVQKDFEPHVSADEYCPEACELKIGHELIGRMGWEKWKEEEEKIRETKAFKECVEKCKGNFKEALVSSAVFDPITRVVDWAVIAHSCSGLWMSEGEDKEKFQKEATHIRKRFEKAGCLVVPENVGHVHPHALAEIGLGPETEYPAVCYIYPEHVDGKCKLDKLLELL